MNKEEVKKIYRLANLSLDGKDVELLSDKFNIVIDFIEDIFTVDCQTSSFSYVYFISF